MPYRFAPAFARLARYEEALKAIAASHDYERAEGRRDPVQHCTQLIRIAEDALNTEPDPGTVSSKRSGEWGNVENADSTTEDQT